MKYRAEIDGLRALAVIPVILFHAGFEWFSGGFVGVDVFFVISGYLITTILIEDIENNRFSIVNFYERRARRILPALFLVMLLCIPFAWILMLPNEMKDFSQSLIAVSLFVSNILFWQESGYFDTNSELKPLLHTWSLAVEEQYYVLFPIFLILAWRFGRNRVFWMIVFIASISLLLSEWGWRNKESANFYLAPTRAWELLAGSLAAFVVQRQGVQKNNALSLLGLSAILFSIFFYNETTPIPSMYALVPVLGVVLLVLYANKDTVVAKFLSFKVFVGAGLISYSAYLWHQPLFAFTRLSLNEQPTLLVMSILSALSMVLAFFSWRFIEKPFRKNSSFSRKNIFSYSLLGICTISLFGFFGDKQNGFESRFSESDLVFLRQLSDKNSEYVVGRFNSLKSTAWDEGKIKVLLVGDSYAQDLTNAIFESDLIESFSLSTWYVSSRCGNVYVPLEEKEKFTSKNFLQRCIKDGGFYGNKDLIKRLKDADEVWFTSSWKHWQTNLIKSGLANIEELTNADIRVFGSKDFPSFEPRRYLGFSLEQRVNFSESIKVEKIELNQMLSELAKDYDYVDIQRTMCGGSVINCKIFDEFGQLKTYDGGHLTKAGAQFLGKHLSDLIINR